MKKTYFLLAAAAIAVAAAACSKKADTTTETTDEKTEVTAEYSGTVPGADVEQIHYNVALTAENDTVGTYDMTSEYMQGDSLVQKFDETGKYVTITKDGQTYIKLGEGAGATYFRCDGDTAITMVNVDLEAPANPAYTMPRTK